MTQTLIITPTPVGFQELGFEPEELDPGLRRTQFSIGDEHYNIATEYSALASIPCDYIFCLRMPPVEAWLDIVKMRLLPGGILMVNVSERNGPGKAKFYWNIPVVEDEIEEALRRWNELRDRIASCL